MTQAHTLAWMHTIFLFAQAHNSAKFGQIPKIKVYMASKDYFPVVWISSSSWKRHPAPQIYQHHQWTQERPQQRQSQPRGHWKSSLNCVIWYFKFSAWYSSLLQLMLEHNREVEAADYIAFFLTSRKPMKAS